MAFKCKACGFDLSVRMDLLAVAISADYPDGEYPKELTLEGGCQACGAAFSFEGPTFTHYMKTKVEEGVISPEVNDYAVVAFDVSPEEHEEFKRLTDEGDQVRIDAFLKRLLEKS